MNIRIIPILCSSLCFASQMYETASSESQSISEINPEHEYVITTQDWVEVTDKTTGEHGWAKLSELKESLSQQNTTPNNWSYKSVVSSTGHAESMHYKPITEEDIQKQIEKMESFHQHHTQDKNITIVIVNQSILHQWRCFLQFSNV